MTRRTSLQPPALHRLEDGGVFGIDRQDRHVAFARFGDQQRPRDDERFLVRQRHGLAGFDRRQNRRKPGRADDGGEHHVHVVAPDQLDQALGLDQP